MTTHPGNRAATSGRRTLAASAAPGSAPPPARARSPLGSRRDPVCPCLAGAGRRCGRRRGEAGDEDVAGLGEWNAAAVAEATAAVRASPAQLYRAGGGGPRRGRGRGGRGAGPGAHATSAGVALPRPPRWEAPPVDGWQHASAAGRPARPAGGETGWAGGVLKGTVTPALLEWTGRWYRFRLRCLCAALSSSFTIIIVLFFGLFGYYLDYYYLQRIGLLSGRQGAFIPVAFLAQESLARPVAKRYFSLLSGTPQTMLQRLPTSKLSRGCRCKNADLGSHVPSF